MITLMERTDATPHYYAHVTRLENLDSIREHGLVPNHNGGNYDDGRWVSLEGVYASQQAEHLSSYLSAHGVFEYGIVVIAVQEHDALPDEDIININIDAAFEATAKAHGKSAEMAAMEIGEQMWEAESGEIDYDDPFWIEVINRFKKTLGQPSGEVPTGLVEQMVDYWFSIFHLEGADAVMDWGDMKDKFTRLFPQMQNAITGTRHSVRIPNKVGFEGSTRIVALVAVHGGHDPEVIYNAVPAEAKADVNQFVYDIIHA